jgi:hypothetical protein
LRRKGHHDSGAIVADALHYLEGTFRVTVHIDHDDVAMLLQHLVQSVEAGRVGRKLPNQHPLASGESAGYSLAALFIRADQRDGQDAGAIGAWNLGKPRHKADATPSCLQQCLVYPETAKSAVLFHKR